MNRIVCFRNGPHPPPPTNEPIAEIPLAPRPLESRSKASGFRVSSSLMLRFTLKPCLIIMACFATGHMKILSLYSKPCKELTNYRYILNKNPRRSHQPIRSPYIQGLQCWTGPYCSVLLSQILYVSGTGRNGTCRYKFLVTSMHRRAADECSPANHVPLLGKILLQVNVPQRIWSHGGEKNPPTD